MKGLLIGICVNVVFWSGVYVGIKIEAGWVRREFFGKAEDSD